ncbi:MAG TPA: GNAT family N-acetyltransferase [Flavitalea sp.]|nr:GNAT family N-acetyltransferase [Flavitalea sp.]
MEYRVVCKNFEQLTAYELYDSLRLRHEVFVLEQNCMAPDMDNMDQHCHHLLLYGRDELLGYARLFAPGLHFPEMSLGRVVSSPNARGIGVGKQLMEEAMKELYRLYGDGPIRIAAQVYARLFYEKLGFVAEGEEYMLDGIQHIDMVRPPRN